MSDGVNDWEQYFSKSNGAWCWASKSRKVTYQSASRSQPAVFKAGWVIRPPPGDDKRALPQYFNVFTGKEVNDRADIPGFIDHPPGASTGTSGSMKRLRPDNVEEDDEAEKDQKKAAAHYNRLERKREGRGRGSVARMRALNNWVKAVLIDGQLCSLSPANSVSILELACGKGGDFFKIRNACPLGSHLTYVGVDIARQSLEEFVRRVRENRGAGGYGGRGTGASSASVRLSCANLGTDRLHGDAASGLVRWVLDGDTDAWGTGPAFHSEDQFDVVSMQFALHYMCQSSERLSRFFASWSANLKDKGCFIATTMDPDVLRRYLRKELSPNVAIRDQLNRLSARMVFDQGTRAALLKDDCGMMLGAKYDMTLTEYDNDETDDKGYNFVEAPEWVVPMASLVHHAWKNGNLFLVHEESLNFHDFFQAKRRAEPKYRELLSRMKVLQSPGDKFSEIEWKLANLYRTLVFKKGGGRRVAIVVPYRDEHKEQQRAKHLAKFVPYMLQYMSRTNTPFHIFIIEQSSDGKKFNRGKLLNAGYEIAKSRRCDAFIFHDVDLLPDKELMKHYRCNGAQFQTVPNHIARVWSRYSNNEDYIGGVTAFSSECFEKVNGFPNNFWGWGGEDDELQKRLAAVNQSFSSPSSGSLTDLEDMTLKEKLALLRKQNTDSEGSDNTWKCMVKNELLNEHETTWRNNGLYHRGQDGQRKRTRLYARSKEDVHPSGFASKITVELLPNNDKWDRVTSWKDLQAG